MQCISLPPSLTDDHHGLGALGASLGGHSGGDVGDDDGFFGHSGEGGSARAGAGERGTERET
jgi:hypothetical protein